ncbi:glutaredoxin family protein [Neoaquamicrobium sediminum]|uniref:Glutaredoxin family protein n=1 Tax=Neoaquamicrobium sediminum TaxID=1849104 RepID=A0ABV3WZC4_9HYPH|nr:glutaredoxin family protein [Mesorhizobium sediminum]NRC56509.1 glutaredoxin family protein [Mesorhizobium sediminum]
MNSQQHAWIVVYTTPTCPDCHALKAWLNAQGIPFVEKDLTDPAIAEEAKTRTGVRVAPITIIGDRILFGTFAAQKPGILSALGASKAA